MSLKHWALSLFFVWHVLAIALSSITAPSAIPAPPVGPPRHPDNDPIAALLTPALDPIAAVVEPFPAVLSTVAGPVRGLANGYIEVTGVSQSWKMFTQPPETHQYLRVRYYVSNRSTARESDSAAWTATELVLPAHREDELRFVQAYWNAFRDKAMTSALARFHGNRDKSLVRPDTKSVELPQDLAPINRYFARRFQDTALRPDERIVRTEIWYGVAPMPPAGAAIDPDAAEARMAVLHDYYQGPVQDHVGRPVYPDYHAVEQEADITWFLEYFEP